MAGLQLIISDARCHPLVKMAQHIVWLPLELQSACALSTSGEASLTIPVLLDSFLWLTAKLVKSFWSLRHTSLAGRPPALKKGNSQVVTAPLYFTSWILAWVSMSGCVGLNPKDVGSSLHLRFAGVSTLLMGFACLSGNTKADAPNSASCHMLSLHWLVWRFKIAVSVQARPMASQQKQRMPICYRVKCKLCCGVSCATMC